MQEKVLYLIPATGMGGFERLFYNFVAISEEYPDVYFASIYAYRGQKANAQLKQKGIKLFYEMDVKRWKNLLYYHYAAFFKILWFIKQKRISIFHAQDTFTMLYGLGIKLILGTTLIRSHHGAENSYWASDNLVFRLTGRWVDMNIFVSSSFYRTFCHNNRIDPGSLTHEIIHNGILVPSEVGSHAGKKDKCFQMIMIGNFYGGRDHLFAVHLLEKLLTAGYEANLVLIGNPSRDNPQKYDACIQYISNRNISGKVKILRGVTDVWPHLRSADLFVYESTRDTFGIAIVEAMLCGIPCLVNDLDVFEEISQQGELCTLFRTQDLDDCFGKASMIFSEYTSYRQRAEAQVERVMQLYSIRGYAEKLMETYKNVLSHG